MVVDLLVGAVVVVVVDKVQDHVVEINLLLRDGSSSIVFDFGVNADG
jgi:hypothetical protein